MGSEREPLHQQAGEKNEHQDEFFTDEEIRVIALIASSRTASEYVANCREVQQLIYEYLRSDFFRYLPFAFRGEIFACPVIQKIISAQEFGLLINRHVPIREKQHFIRWWMRQLFPLSHQLVIAEIERIWEEKEK